MKTLSVTLLVNDRNIVLKYIPSDLSIEVSGAGFCCPFQTKNLFDDNGEYTQQAWEWVQGVMNHIKLTCSWDRVEFVRIIKQLAS